MPLLGPGSQAVRAVSEDRETFGLSALSGILLEEVAEATGRDQAQVLADIHRGYLTGRASRPAI
jgi:hypothetical protein